jgi:hypothetical protein
VCAAAQQYTSKLVVNAPRIELMILSAPQDMLSSALVRVGGSQNFSQTCMKAMPQLCTVCGLTVITNGPGGRLQMCTKWEGDRDQPHGA